MLLSFQTKQRPRNKLCFAEKINQENIRCGLAPGGVSVKTVRAGRRILTKFNKQRQLITARELHSSTHVADTALGAFQARRDRNTNHNTLSNNTIPLDIELNPPWTLDIWECVDWVYSLL